MRAPPCCLALRPCATASGASISRTTTAAPPLARTSAGAIEAGCPPPGTIRAEASAAGAAPPAAAVAATHPIPQSRAARKSREDPTRTIFLIGCPSERELPRGQLPLGRARRGG